MPTIVWKANPAVATTGCLMIFYAINGVSEGIVVADCGAIADFYKLNTHQTHPDAASASSAAVRTGTDLDCGTTYEALIDGVKAGYISEKILTFLSDDCSKPVLSSEKWTIPKVTTGIISLMRWLVLMNMTNWL